MLTPAPLVFSGNLMSGQVGWPHAASGIANSGKIGDASVVSGSIGSGQIASGHTCSGFWPAVFTLVSGQVGSGLIASGAVPGFFGPYRGIMSGTVGVFDLGSGAVVAGAVGSGAIQSGNVASGQIGTNHHASGQILGLVTATIIASGTFNGFELGSGSIVSGRIASGQIGRNHFGPDPTYLHNGNNGCRVSLSSGTPITSGMGVSGTVNLYLVPFRNNTISLIDSSGEVQWIRAPLNTQLNLSGVLASGAAYDVYGVISGGNVALELGAAWSFPQSGVREGGCAIAYNTSGGFWTKSGDATRRVLASVTSFFSGVLSDGDLRRMPVWNFDKDSRVPTHVAVSVSDSSWTYAAVTYRVWNAVSGYAVQYIVGLAPAEPIWLVVQGTIQSNCSPTFGVGLDSTTVSIADCSPFATGGGGTATYVELTSEASVQSPQGVHRLYMLERCGNTVLTTFWGTQSGIPNGGAVGEMFA